MNHKEKAKALVDKYRNVAPGILYTKYEAKQCAIIAIDEILKTHSHDNIIGIGGYYSDKVIEFWQQVRKEIEQL